MPFELILFYVFGAAAIAASLMVIGQRNPMYSVLLLIASFAALAGLYVLLDAPFLAVIQIIIYAGAIMVLFLFVVMLLNAAQEEIGQVRILAGRGGSPAAFDGRSIPPGCVTPPSNIPDILGRRALPGGRLARLGATLDFHHGLLATPSTRRIGTLLAIALLVELAWALSRAGQREVWVTAPSDRLPSAVVSVRAIGLALFRDYAFAFEVTSVLILVAMLGAVVLAKREL